MTVGTGQATRHTDRRLAAIKLIHTIVWFSIESAMAYVLWSGFTRRSDRRAAIAAAVVGAETLVFAANDFHCPLTEIAEHLGAEDGAVTDIYLPGWFARNPPAIHVPLIVLAAYLHGRNLREADVGSCARGYAATLGCSGRAGRG